MADSLSELTRKDKFNCYIELASPQLLDDKWRELNFDLASGQNVLQDLVMPESGGGYVYRDVSHLGSATHNRFLYWRIANDILELVEISTESVLDDNQVRIRFVNSPVINSVNVIEFSESIVIMIATLTSVHRLSLSHPKTTDKSVLHDLTSDVLFNPANYYILNNNQSSPNSQQQPICASSWHDKNLLKCALSFPNSSLLLVQFGRNSHHISTSDIKQIGIIGRLWSRMPNLLARNPNDCDNAVFVCTPYHHYPANDVLLFTLCRDWKIRVFSTNSRECILTHNMIPQSSFSQSFASHTNPTTEQPMMKMFGNNIVVYLTENQPEFVILSFSGADELKELLTIQTPSWEKLIDFSVTNDKIWALANIRETESALCYLSLSNVFSSDVNSPELEEVWEFVNFEGDLDMPTVKNYVTEIFWRNHFSVATVQKALVGVTGHAINKKTTMDSLEGLAYTRIVDESQEEAWTRFYNYCLQNHQASNKNIGLITGSDESIISIVKRSNPSFICPWMANIDMILQGGPYRGIKFSEKIRGVIEPLNYISTEIFDDEHSNMFEEKLLQNPSLIGNTISEIVESISKQREIVYQKLNFNHKGLIVSGIDYICEQLDLTDQAAKYGEKILEELSSRLHSDHNPLESNSGITITFELFKRLVRARMILARDLLIYIRLMETYSVSEKSGSQGRTLNDLVEKLYTTSRIRRVTDCLRSYIILVWISETPVKSLITQVHTNIINFVSDKFDFFKKATQVQSHDSLLDMALNQNLLMNFLVNGGSSFLGPVDDISDRNSSQTVSNTLYVTEIALNICRLLWPQSRHLCFAEFLFTHQLEDHLEIYLDLTEDWIPEKQHDRHFIKAANCLLQGSTTHSVEIFNRLWMNMTHENLLGRFIDLEPDNQISSPEDRVHVTPALIYKYYNKLIQLFQISNNYQCLVMLINSCMALLDSDADKEQQHWANCFRAKLFQYHLELEDSDEAYHTMVLTSDASLRINCLRKFIVSHCEKEQWSNLLSYPFIDIKNDFIEILNQKAETSDLSKLTGDGFYKTSYYDLLFASYVSDDEFKRAAHIMYSYAQRLAHEVPGITSIRKQADCLLIALNSLRSVDDQDGYLESESNLPREEGRSSVLKRSYDSETGTLTPVDVQDEDIQSIQTSVVSCRDVELMYELTRARLKLLEKDQTANAIALSPLKAEETIGQLVASSMYSAAIDLALLFKAPMEPILEGLTAKFIFILRLSTVDIAVHQDSDRGLSDIFTNSYSNIDTYNYVANSTSTFVEKLWRLIDYYLITYDGISHTYSTDNFSGTFNGTTLLMRVVANKLLSAGYDVPASLKRMYMTRNTAELLKLLIKYDKLADATDLAIEMIDKTLEPTNCFTYPTSFTTNEPPPVYLPTHLILLLLSFLNEDATNTHYVKLGHVLSDRLGKFRRFVKS